MKRSSFLRYTLRFSLLFLIVFTLLKLLLSFIDLGVQATIDRFFSADTWFRFVRIQLLLSLGYGLFMAGYYTLFKKR
jgi:uncharacterized BrkB/YihY/UPF0761 family membrane protein